MKNGLSSRNQKQGLEEKYLGETFRQCGIGITGFGIQWVAVGRTKSREENTSDSAPTEYNE